MNSRKSVCSFAKSSSVTLHQFEQQVQSFLGCEMSVEVIVGTFRFVKRREQLRNSFHCANFIMESASRLLSGAVPQRPLVSEVRIGNPSARGNFVPAASRTWGPTSRARRLAQ